MELKTPKGSGNLSTNQINWLQRLEGCGWKTLVSCDLLEVIGQLEGYMKPCHKTIGQTSGSAVSSRTTMSGTSTVRPEEPPEK